jgi:hypothetical protein
MKNTLLAVMVVMLGISTPVFAGDPEIVGVAVEKTGMTWRMDVTIRHDDTGWDHYADGWEVLDAAGNRLGYRKLMHPHVAEQPFTRSLSSLVVPDGTREVFVRARCSKKGWSDERVRVELRP